MKNNKNNTMFYVIALVIVVVVVALYFKNSISLSPRAPPTLATARIMNVNFPFSSSDCKHICASAGYLGCYGTRYTLTQVDYPQLNCAGTAIDAYTFDSAYNGYPNTNVPSNDGCSVGSSGPGPIVCYNMGATSKTAQIQNFYCQCGP